MRVESTRLICPAPMPSVRPPPQKTIALLFTNLATRHANSRSESCGGVGAFSVTTLNSDGADVPRIGALQQEAAADALHVELRRRGDRRERDLQHAHVLLLRDHRERIRRIARRDQHLEKLRRHGLERRRVDRPAEGDDAAERRGRVRRERIPVGGERTVGKRRAAGIRVLDDHARGGVPRDASVFAHSQAASESARLLNESSLPCSWRYVAIVPGAGFSSR